MKHATRRSVNEDAPQPVNQEYISVSVNKEGIININFNCTYNISDVINEDVEIIDFEQAEEIAEAQIEKTLNGKQLTVTEIEFGYMTLSYNDSEYSLVPVWVYYGATSKDADTYRYPLFAINALNCEVIEFVEDSLGIY